jgi:hypothetical protein
VIDVARWRWHAFGRTIKTLCNGLARNRHRDLSAAIIRGQSVNRTVYAASAIVVAALAGSAYFFRSSLLSAPSRPPAVAEVTKVDRPSGAILMPMGDDRCLMRALDNATGRIEDYGVVNCSKASSQNWDAWRRAMSQDKFVEIGKSFRHETDQSAKNP